MLERECERVGLPAPSFSQDGVIVKISFVRPNNTSNDTNRVSKSKFGVSRSTGNNTGNSTSNSTSSGTDNGTGISTSSLEIFNGTPKKYPQSCIKLIVIIGEDRWTLYDMLEILGLKSRPSFIKTYLNPAIKEGLVTLENPNKPNAPNQRYGLTTKGKALYYERQNGIDNVPMETENDPQKDLEGQLDPLNASSDPLKSIVFKAIKDNPSISRAELAGISGCSESTIKRRLKEWNIAWLGHPKNGHWVVVKEI
ncbi:MAG: winged helix-turn-helix domain-containing protein [Muribaculaceae bacterium]|nr:winged helix-turn-helix domain-containing protein [Muribaculaceae bacterium]